MSILETRRTRKPVTSLRFVHLFLSVVLIVLPSRAAVAQAKIAAKLLSATGGKRVKIVWQQDQSQAGNNVFGDANVFKLFAYDSLDDTVRVVASAQDDYTKPLITHDGNRIVYSDRKEKKVRVINWDGSGTKTIASGFAGGVWFDEKSGTQWVYFQEGGNGDSSSAPVKRINLDDPTEVQLVWNKTQTNILWMAISGDAKHLASCWPWPSCGVITPSYDGSGGGTSHLSSGGSYFNGCWTTITPDTKHRVAVFDEPHRNWRVLDGPPPGNNARTVNLSAAPGINGWEIYHPKHANHPQFITMTGPYSAGPMGANNIMAGGPQVEVYFGKTDAGFTKVTSWIKVTSNNKADFFPDAWIDPGTASQVEIKKFKAQPQTITAGKSATLVWETKEATKVSIDNGIGEVTPSGSVTVSPSQSATYTLTAEGPEGPRSRKVTVTVATEEPRLSAIRISPSMLVVKPGETTNLVAEPLDQYDRTFAAPIQWRVEGQGAIAPSASDGAVTSHEVTFTPGGEGMVATITASSGPVEGEATIEVVDEPKIVIINPRAGDRWLAGSTQKIQWTTNLEDVALQLSHDGGATFVNIATSVDRTMPEWGDFSWQVSGEASDSALINIKGYFGEAPTNSEQFSIDVDVDGEPPSGEPPSASSLLLGGCEAGGPPGTCLPLLLVLLCFRARRGVSICARYVRCLNRHERQQSGPYLRHAKLIAKRAIFELRWED